MHRQPPFLTHKGHSTKWLVCLVLGLLLPARALAVQPAPSPSTAPAPVRSVESKSAIQPFGATLFSGNFLQTREDGVNANYVIMPGDQVSVYSWGALELNKTFVVDGQGNIFLSEIGPIRLAGVKNRDLTSVVEKGIRRVYTRYLNVYTNLLTAKPVGVFVTGGVKSPGRYAGIPSDSLLFYLDQAGGIDAQLGSYRSIRVLRKGEVVANMDLYDFLLKGQIQEIQFAEGDVILVGQRGPVVTLIGNVALPSFLEFQKKRTRGADALQIVPSSARATGATITGIRSGLPYSQTMGLTEFRRTELLNGDRIRFREDLAGPTVLINVEGETLGASQMTVKRGAHLVDVLNTIRVDPDLADTDAVHLRRSSVARAQKDSIEDSLFRLERSALLALSSSNGESEIRVREAELTRKFVEKARLIQPLGRVVTSAQGSQQNILLEEGDTIVIPRRTSVIRIGGEVLISQAVMFQENLVAENYINMSGGYTDRAESDRVIIFRANAEVVVGDLSSPIFPGDEILIPPRVDTKALQSIVDFTQVVYQIAVAAAVVIAL